MALQQVPHLVWPRRRYLIWYDYFNVMQMIILTLVLVMVLVEHRLIVEQERVHPLVVALAR